MLKHTVWFGLALAFTAASGCSSSDGAGNAKGAGGEDSGSASGTVKDYCAQSCDKSHSCDKKVDVQTCTNDCKNSFAAVGPKLRDDFLASITECYQKEDCVSVLDDKALGKCTAEAVAELAPTKEGTSFCTDYEAAVEKCDGTFDKANCYDQAKTFNDDSLKEAEACLDKTCSDIDDCVEATLGKIEGADSSSNNGTGGTTGTGGTSGSGNEAGTTAAGGTGGTGLSTGKCTADSPSQCASATEINACVGGKYVVTSCKNYLGAVGFEGSSCTDDSCDIGAPIDADCATGAAAACACSTCTDADQVGYYIQCFQDDPAGSHAAFVCMADAQDCTAVAACVP